MQVCSAQEALFIACEMERGAVQLYERAMMLPQGQSDESLYAHLQAMLHDEQQHLRQFSALYAGLDAERERALMLSATASEILFPGGLMGAARSGLLLDAESLLRFAADAEVKAAATYRSFADQCENPDAADMLRAVAGEEDKHLDTLRGYQQLLG